MPSWHSRQEALELGMRLRILWEPHISTQSTLLLLPAHPCSPTRAEEGRGEWPELKYGAPRKSTTSCPALVSQPCLVSSLGSTFLWRLEITRSPFLYLLVVWYSLYFANMVGKYSFSRARQLQPSHRSSRTSSTPASLPSLLVSENLNSNRIALPLATWTQVGWPLASLNLP